MVDIVREDFRGWKEREYLNFLRFFFELDFLYLLLYLFFIVFLGGGK